jgi:hypothetical protein
MDGPTLQQGGMTYKKRPTDRRPYLARVADHRRLLAAVEARGQAGAGYEAAQKCPKLTKKGRQCQGLASEETGLCPGHQLQAEAQARRAEAAVSA